MFRLLHKRFIDVIIYRGARFGSSRSNSSMQFRGHPNHQSATVRFCRNNTSSFATLEIAVDRPFKIRTDLIDRCAFIRYKCATQSLYFSEKTIIILTEFHRPCIAFIFKLSHIKSILSP